MPLVEDASCSIQPSGSSNTITLRDNDNNDEAKTTRGEDTEWEETGGGYGNRKTQSGGAARPALMEEVRAKLAEPAVNPMNLHLRDTPDRGRGVFASHPIPTGTLVEESPVLVLSKSEWENGKLDGTLLGSHGFCWSNGGMAIGLGLASLFNHSNTPNVNFIRNPSTSTILFRTSRSVEAGEELCIYYSPDETMLWSTPAHSTHMNGDASLSEDEEEMIFPELGPEDLTRPPKQERAGQGKRKTKYFKKRIPSNQEKPNDEAVILSPQPVAFTGSIVPDLQDYPRPDVPAPLHSGKNKVLRHEHVGPVVLTPDLDWREEKWFDGEKEREGSSSSNDSWGEVVRIKGPAERMGEDAGADEMLDVWVVEVTDPRMTREVLNFCKTCASDYRMRHLKRVARRLKPDGSGDYPLIALCLASNLTLTELLDTMATFDPPLSDLSPFLITAPASPARSLDQLRVKSAIWPTLYAPSPVRPTTSHTWSPARKAWVKAGIYRVLSLARAAKAKGELPVAVFCTSPPQHFWPGPDGFIPPTTGLRAVSHDTRTSEAHPLRHATLNCIASIARLRTVPPFNVVQPTRNGADYLLTSLSLFCTHEPCVMCCMALLHSRVREVFYVFPRPRGGGFEGAFGVHGRRDLNHRFEAWRWSEGGMEGWEEELRVDEGVAI